MDELSVKEVIRILIKDYIEAVVQEYNYRVAAIENTAQWGYPQQNIRDADKRCGNFEQANHTLYTMYKLLTEDQRYRLVCVIENVNQLRWKYIEHLNWMLEPDTKQLRNFLDGMKHYGIPHDVVEYVLDTVEDTSAYNYDYCSHCAGGANYHDMPKKTRQYKMGKNLTWCSHCHMVNTIEELNEMVILVTQAIHDLETYSARNFTEDKLRDIVMEHNAIADYNDRIMFHGKPDKSFMVREIITNKYSKLFSRSSYAPHKYLFSPITGIDAV